MKIFKYIAALLLLLLVFPVGANSDDYWFRSDEDAPGLELNGDSARVSSALDDYGFRFIRIKFEPGGSGNEGMYGRRRFDPKWNHDYPAAEYNLYDALKRTTEIRIDGNPLILTLKDKRIFEYPILYLCEPGFWAPDLEEIENTREYFARGGFMLFDDFRWYDEFSNFAYQIRKIFPEGELKQLEPDHPVWSVYYDVDPIEAPSLVSGVDSKYDDEYWGMYDKNGRLLFLACYNQDIGDGWEWPDRNFQDASTISFQMGVNIIIYALTH